MNRILSDLIWDPSIPTPESFSTPEPTVAPTPHATRKPTEAPTEAVTDAPVVTETAIPAEEPAAPSLFAGGLGWVIGIVAAVTAITVAVCVILVRAKNRKR